MADSLRICLLRHASTGLTRPGVYYGHTDAPLDDCGREQARRAADMLRDTRFDAVVASDLARCVETARLALPQGPSAQTFAEWREIDFGAWEGLHYTQAMGDDAAWKAFCAGEAPPGGESAAVFFARVACAWDALIKGRRNGNILVVTHHGCIRAAIAHALGLGPGGEWRFQVSPASMSVIGITDGYAVLRALNVCEGALPE